MTWHILTGEYPPGCGGVGDYTAGLAHALAAAGDHVHVWTVGGGQAVTDARISVHRLPDAFGARSRQVLDASLRETPGVVLLQYVPNALGARGANLPFCFWFARLRRRMPDVRVMFHEPYFYFRRSRPWAASNALAIVQRLMARVLLGGSMRVYYSTETWRRYLRPGNGRAAQALPIPSTIPSDAGDAAIARAREAATGGDRGALLAGHFGTYGAHVAAELRTILPELVARMPAVRIALLGDGGPAFVRDLPSVAGRAWAPGRLEPAEVAAALRACDVLLQPYPDGITTRRTSAMAGIGNGVATVSTSGALTEPVWNDTGAVALVPAGDARAFVEAAGRLLRDADARTALGRRAAEVYTARFSMAHTVAILRGAPAS